MTAGELAALIVSICSVVAVVLLAFGVVALFRALARMQDTVDQLRAETLPVVSELQRTVAGNEDRLRQIDDLLASARTVSGRMDSASRLAYLAFSNPVIKAMALGTGTSRAARALRRR
jgi:ABC-type lipoprotein release transport system permease subunit